MSRTMSPTPHPEPPRRFKDHALELLAECFLACLTVAVAARYAAGQIRSRLSRFSRHGEPQ